MVYSFGEHTKTIYNRRLLIPRGRLRKASITDCPTSVWHSDMDQETCYTVELAIYACSILVIYAFMRKIRVVSGLQIAQATPPIQGTVYAVVLWFA